MMKGYIFIALFLCIILVSCSGSYSYAEHQTPSLNVQTSIPSPTVAQSSSNGVGTSTPVPISFTLTPNPNKLSTVPSLLPIGSVEERCGTEKKLQVSDFFSNGEIILAKYQSAVGGNADLMALKPQKTITPLNLPEYDGFRSVSPDRQWLFYKGGEKTYLVSSNGTIQSSYPMRNQWLSNQGWLDNNRIAIARGDRTKIGIDVYNPFENKVQKLEPEFKDFWQYDFESSGWRVWKLVYDPTLTLVAYMRNANGPEFVLHNQNENKDLWNLKRGSIGLDTPPKWSPDGKLLEVIASNDPEDNSHRFQLFTVSHDGYSTQWVDIPNSIIFGDSGAQWSPDSRYIAFHGSSLYVLDMEKHTLIDYCIPPNPNRPDGGDIIWSPDSKQLIYQRDEMSGLLVDIERNYIAPITEDSKTVVVGWLRDMP